MHSFEKKIFSLIQVEHLISQGEKVVIGVSGGADSTALLLVLASLRQQLQLGLLAIYVDHGLRPLETPAEKKALCGLCRSLAVDFIVKSVDVNGEVQRCKASIEEAARKLRYLVFTQGASGFAATKIAVGHTADDQAEEVLLRLIRGTARSGLSGMRLLRDQSIVRPLLQVTKDEIHAYLKDKQTSFLEDSSNVSRQYLRNQVRLDILPFLRRYNPAIDVNLRRVASILQDEEDLLVQQTEEKWQALVDMRSQGDGRVQVEWGCAEFTELHVAFKRRLAEKMFIVMQSPPSGEKIKQLLYLIQSGQGGGQLHFARGLRALKKKGRMLFWYPQGITASKGNLFE